MELSLFDLHCDTAYEMLQKSQPLSCNELAVSLENAKKFRRYVQVMALWTDHRCNDEDGWSQALAMLENLKKDPSVHNKDALLCAQYPAPVTDKPVLLLGVEDARILAGKLDRLDTLHHLGIRILTPLWKGETCIGGSHDTSVGLTDFGRKALQAAVKRDMILDISHASEASSREIFEISEQECRPVIASHSNAYAVCSASRNLHDWQIDRIVENGGLIGLNLYGAFLRNDGNATVRDVFPHIDYFLSHGAQDVLCLGCDMDGCDLPPDLPSLASLPRLADLMHEYGYTEELIHAIFFENADRFFRKHLA